MTRITDLNSTPYNAILAIAGGNPEAISVASDIIVKSPAIDPDDFMGGLGTILQLDTMGIYEDRIWMLYKGVCGESMEKTLAALRAVQLGLRPEEDLIAAIDGKSQINIDDWVAAVKAELPDFASSTN